MTSPTTAGAQTRGQIKPRDDKGRFLAFFCEDRNCSGVLVFENDRHHGCDFPEWRCDGLTFDRDDGPLRVCSRSYPANRAALSAQVQG